jgi:hypothetical protein
MDGLEDHPHPASTDPVEHHVRSDEQSPALTLVEGRRLVARQHLGPHQLMGHARDVERTLFGSEPTHELTETTPVKKPQFGEELVERSGHRL